jgi:hypothetical protein
MDGEARGRGRVRARIDPGDPVRRLPADHGLASASTRRPSPCSPSVLDAGLKDIGIVVDEQGMVPMDRLGDPAPACSSRGMRRWWISSQRGARARIQLRFWPTWPETGTHSAMLSLMGFTRAHARLDDCK